MSSIGTFLQLIRYKNIILLMITQCIVYVSFMNPFRMIESSYFYLDISSFILLVISTASITAGGYIINDYFDIQIDAINRPSAALVTHRVAKKTALLLHLITTMLGISLAFIVAYRVGYIYLALIQVVTAVLLWLYSTRYKKVAHVGNLLVSILTAGSILVVWIYNPILHRYITSDILLIGNMINPFYLIMGVTLFALLINWMREIVKDIEDYEGDEAMGCRTLPIVKGIDYAKRFTIVIGVFTIMLFLMLVIYFISIPMQWYKVTIIFLPIISLIYTLYLTHRATAFTDFATISSLLKWTMVQCLLLIVIYAYL